MTHPMEEQKNDSAMYHSSNNFNCGNIYDVCEWVLKPVTLDLIIRDGGMENLSSVTSVETTNWAGREKV
jgi:hypothetical protein